MMIKALPKGKLSRSWVGGKTAAKISGKTLRFLAKKPFLDGASKVEAREVLNDEAATLLIEGLSLLKGTALKLAQSLSLEMDMLPESVCRKLEQSYNQVPPLNAVLVRKMIKSDLGAPPDKIFSTFEPKAFAAASLGQVHRATSREGRRLAVKIQYPGISETITSDIKLISAAIRALPDGRLLTPLVSEIEERLREETDYRLEADNARYFARHLPKGEVQIPRGFPELSSGRVLTMEYLDGPDLQTWLNSGPSQKERDRVANRLNALFLFEFYEMKCIHADPNPGNYIIGQNGNTGLLDFGCVKRFAPAFVESYRCFPGMVVNSRKEDYIGLMKDLKLIKPDISPEAESEIVEIYHPIARWYGQLYRNNYFDFGNNKDFFAEGKRLMSRVRKIRKYFGDIDPSFVFLDRTRYGLMRLFEKMGAKVRINNMYESVT